MNKDDEDTLGLVSKSLKYENESYKALTQRTKERHHQMVLNRLNNAERRLIKEPELVEKYCEIIKHYIKKEYLEYVGVEDERMLVLTQEAANRRVL